MKTDFAKMVDRRLSNLKWEDSETVLAQIQKRDSEPFLQIHLPFLRQLHKNKPSHFRKDVSK